MTAMAAARADVASMVAVLEERWIAAQHTVADLRALPTPQSSSSVKAETLSEAQRIQRTHLFLAADEETYLAQSALPRAVRHAASLGRQIRTALAIEAVLETTEEGILLHCRVWGLGIRLGLELIRLGLGYYSTSVCHLSGCLTFTKTIHATAQRAS